MTVIGIYMSPNGNEVLFSKFLNLLADLTRNNQNFILRGDFNINALTPNNPSTKRLTDVLKTFGLEFLVSSPMRVTSTSQTAIVLISNCFSVVLPVIDTAISDLYGQMTFITGIPFLVSLHVLGYLGAAVKCLGWYWS